MMSMTVCILSRSGAHADSFVACRDMNVDYEQYAGFAGYRRWAAIAGQHTGAGRYDLVDLSPRMARGLG